MSHLAASSALAALAASCVAFNECEADRSERIGSAAISLDLRESVVRTQEASVGNVVADALLEVATVLCAEGATPCPDMAFQNAGGLRQETSCGTRDAIEQGPIYASDIDDLMPFENQLVVVTLPGSEVLRALERGVASLKLAGEAGQAGSFLQVAGISFDVDCDEPAQTLAPDHSAVAREGTRIRNVLVTSRDPPELLDRELEYEVAMNSFIASGRDGFLSFYFLDEAGAVVVDGDGEPVARLDPARDVVKDEAGVVVSDRRAVKDFIRAEGAGGVGGPTEGRIRASGCFGSEP